ncbi:MAG: heavy metal transport/detoxification protein [Flavihumibacter sp.]|jgi:copper chaperone CopZ|nr:heavy metal transport/detoxification protein [Flavihumibacter sp.]
METLQFKTTIKCSGCIEKVTPYLNETVGENNWEVDLQNPQKVLTIPGSDQIKSSEVVDALAKAGYKAEKI